MKSISVVIPTLNEENYLPHLLQDLLEQTDKDFEVVICDGYSVDKTKEVYEKFSKRLKINFIETHKKNVSHQRNLGAYYAKNDYIFFIDADSQLPKNYIRQLKKIIDKSPHLIYIPAITAEHVNSKINIILHLFNYASHISQTTRRPLCTGGSMIIERSFFTYLKGFDESLYISEDGEILMRAKKRGVTAHFISSPLIRMSIRRIEYEGYLTLLRKYFVNMTHTLKNKDGAIKKRIFEYEMGGWRYGRVPNTPLEKKIKRYLDKIAGSF